MASLPNSQALWQLTKLSFSFFLLFTSFNFCQNMASKVLYDDGFESLGFVTVATLYFCFALCSFFSTAIVNKINNLQLSMSLGALCYSFWIVGFLAPSLYSEYLTSSKPMPWYLNKTFIKSLLIITAGINGAGAGILWVSQGKFISELADHENTGFVNSFFWVFLMGSQIIGNILAIMVMRSGVRQSTLFMLFALIALAGSLILATLRENQSKPQFQRYQDIQS